MKVPLIMDQFIHMNPKTSTDNIPMANSLLGIELIREITI